MKRRIFKLPFWLAGIALLVAACSLGGETPLPPGEETAPSGPEAAGGELEGLDWKLVALAGEDGALADALADTEVTAVFADGRINGRGGCNNYFGPYELDGSQLTFGEIASTQMACFPDTVMQQESAYFQRLAETASFNATGEQLELLNAAGETLLRYERLSAQPLAGTPWRLTDYNNGQDAVVSVLNGTEITALFGEDGSLSGTAGCNRYNTSYEVDGQNLTIGPAATTRMACPQPAGVMEQEAAYLAALERAATYAIQGDRLELRADDGAILLNYAAGAPGEAQAPAAPATPAESSGPGSEPPAETAETPEAAPQEAMFPVALTFDNQGLAQQVDTQLIRPTPFDNTQGPVPTGAPLHIQVSFDGRETLRIFPIEQYALLWAQGGDNRISAEAGKLRGLLEERPTGDLAPLPLLPPPTGYNDLAAQVAYLDFDGGSGVRFVGRVTPEPGPVHNPQLRYYFQGLSADGKYYLTFEYPLTTPTLPEGLEGVPPEVAQQAGTDFAAYIQAVHEQLNARAPGEFSPSLETLDALVRSIRLAPTAGAAAPGGAQAGALTGTAWQWVETRMSDDTTISSPDPAAYTLQFMADGSVSGQADCNVFRGAYQADGPTLEIEMQMTSLAACPEGSLSDLYLQQLGDIASYVIQEGQLYLAIKFDSGIMQFQPVP